MARAILPGVRFSYAHLYELDQNDKYSLTVLIPKDTPNGKIAYENATRAVEEAQQEGINKKFGGKLPPNLANPIHDGDGTKRNGEPYGQECKGHWVINTSTTAKNPPGLIVGRDKAKSEEGEICSGDYGVVTVSFAPYSFNGNKGIGAYLNNVWKTKTGESLAGRRSAQDDFRNVSTDTLEFDDYDIDPLTGMPITQ